MGESSASSSGCLRDLCARDWKILKALWDMNFE